MEILELKNTITKYKNSMDGLRIIEKGEERICRLENRATENTQCEKQTEKFFKNFTNFHAIGVPEREGKKGGTGKGFGEKKCLKFPLIWQKPKTYRFKMLSELKT